MHSIHSIPQILLCSVSNNFYSRHENYDKERHILKLIDDIKANWKRGLLAVAVFIGIWIVVFFIAFMTAFGNDSPMARAILEGVRTVCHYCKPLVGNSHRFSYRDLLEKEIILFFMYTPVSLLVCNDITDQRYIASGTSAGYLPY